ncbi:MAG: hypothetical protein CVU39_13310 [Chloroflexi bacterium HGW-Chloroflexi-10]|nr:MAG: hypothetical protein CVU39_13310 [Chloroflexi bacterium HGW-Chloroflexi-10]
MKTSNNKMHLGRTWLYSSASIGLNILSITVSTWLLYFYAPPPDSGRISYLPVSLVGLLLTIVGLWDAVIDPFIGHLSDTLRSRWGRRRPFLLFGAPFVAIAVVLLWLPPVNGTTLSNTLYFIFSTLLFFTCFSLIGIPYDATLPEMAPESKDRLKLSYWKNLFGIIGVLIGTLAAAPLFVSIGPVAMGIVVGIVGMLTIWISFFGIRDNKRIIEHPMPVLTGIRATLKNKQFLYVFGSTLLVHITYQMLLANLPYFVTLVMKATEGDVAIYQGVLIVCMAATGPLWTVWNKKHSQQKLLKISMLILAATLLLGFAIGSIPGIPLMAQGLVLMGLCGFSLGGYLIIIYALMGNVVDYDEILNGQRREAIFYGSFSLALGLGIAFGTLILPQLLNLFGYTQENPMGVRIAFLVMSACVMVGFLIFRGYKLGETPKETKKTLKLKPNK